MKNLLLILALSCTLQLSNAQSKTNSNDRIQKLEKKIADLEQIVEDKNKQQELLNSDLQLFKAAYDNQWAHFSRMVDLMGVWIAIIVPLLGLLAFIRFKKNVKGKISRIESSVSDFEKKTSQQMETSRIEVLALKKKSLAILAQNEIATSYVYLRLPNISEFDQVNHLPRALNHALESIQINAQLYFEANNSEEGRDSIMNSITYTEQIFASMRGNNMNQGMHLEWNQARALRNYDFDYMHKLRIHFPDSMDTLNAFERNLREFHFYPIVR